MKNYTITVNGIAYDVCVEEKSGVTPVVAAAPAPVVAAPTPAAVTPAPVAPSPAAPVASAGTGRVKITAGAAGKVFKVVASVGQAVKKGDSIIILEAMKMEIPIVASEDGTVAEITVAEGAMIESGAVVATLN